MTSAENRQELRDAYQKFIGEQLPKINREMRSGGLTPSFRQEALNALQGFVFLVARKVIEEELETSSVSPKELLQNIDKKIIASLQGVALDSSLRQEKGTQTTETRTISVLDAIKQVYVVYCQIFQDANLPITWEEYLQTISRDHVDILRDMANEVLHPPETPEFLPTQATSSLIQTGDEEDALEIWKESWFSGDIKLIKNQSTVEALKGATAPEILPFVKSKINEIANLEDLREVACAWLSIMFGSSEVQQESYRTEIFDLLRMQAVALAQKEGTELARKKAEFISELLVSCRELYVFWWDGWMGRSSGEGSSSSMASIATAAGKMDTHRTLDFLLRQKAIAVAYHEEDIYQSKKLSQEVRRMSSKNAIWRTIGYMLRRCTGAAIYDGIRQFTEIDYQRIVDIVQKYEDISLNDEVQIAASMKDMEAELAQAVADLLGGIKPNSVDYILFLNHFIPWYLNVRYRQKFKDRIDIIYDWNIEGLKAFFDELTTPGVVSELKDDKVLQRLRHQFEAFNLGEIGAYSLHKRPDTWGAWDQNLRIIVAVAEDSRVRLGKKEFEQVIADLEAKKEQYKKDPRGERIIEAKKVSREIDCLQRARKVYLSFKDNPEVLQAMIEQGVDFGMRMLGLFDDKEDWRSPTSKQKSEHTDWSIFGLNSRDWQVDTLLSFSTEKKLRILSTFIHRVAERDRARIIKNNLIATRRINTPLADKIHEMDLTAQSWFQTDIYDEVVSMDDLYSARAHDTWLRFFDQDAFSLNAFVMYEHYAETMRKLIHQMFAKETDPTELLKVKHAAEASANCKHLIDTAHATLHHETGRQVAWEHDVAWRLERTSRAIEAYVSQLYMLTVALYRKQGVRLELAVGINKMVQAGINDSIFRAHQFEPATSEAERQAGIEYSYTETDALLRADNSFRLRFIFNLAGFEGNWQREIWEKGFLAKINEDEGEKVEYDVLLMFAGLQERAASEIKKADEVRGYRVDQELASVWFNFYQHFKKQIPRVAELTLVNPVAREMILTRARKFACFKGKSDQEIVESIDKQFHRLFQAFNDKAVGLFSGIFTYQRNMDFIWEKVIDTYLQKTFDVEHRHDESGVFSLDFMRRESEKSWLIRRRKYAIEGGEGFDKYIVTQVITEDSDGKKLKKPRLVNAWDDENYEWHLGSDGQKIRGECKYLHGLEEIESWLLGSGELDWGTGARLTRLPNYFNKYGLLYLYLAIFSPGVAAAVFKYRGLKKWAEGFLQMVDGPKGSEMRILQGPWMIVLTNKKVAAVLERLRDPGELSIFDEYEIKDLKEFLGCSEMRVAEYREKCAELGIIDFEMGQEKALQSEMQQEGEFLDRPLKMIAEFPTSILGTELGAMLPAQDLLKSMNSRMKREILLKNNVLVRGMIVGGLGMGIGLTLGLLGLTAGGMALIGWGISGFALNGLVAAATGHKATSFTDLDPYNGSGTRMFSNAIVKWLFTTKIFGVPLLDSVAGRRIRARDFEVLLGRKGKRMEIPAYDDIAIPAEAICKDFVEQKKELSLESDLTKGGGGQHG